MDDDCVPWAEMRWTGSETDPIDAVLDDGAGGDDLLAVAAVVHDLRSAYGRTDPLDVRSELAGFTGALLDTDHDSGADVRLRQIGSGGVAQTDQSRKKASSMLSVLGGFVGTLTGKAVLGTAVTAASVGGLHAADVVDVPVLPDTRSVSEQSGPPADTPSDGGSGGQDTADENLSAATAYTDAVQEWTDCVADAAAGQGDAETRTTGQLDPRGDCGDQPSPADFGLGDLPEQAADAAQDALDTAPVPDPPATPGPAAPGGPEGTIPVTTPDSNDPTSGGANTPAPETPAPADPDATSTAPGSPAPSGSGPDAPGGGRP